MTRRPSDDKGVSESLSWTLITPGLLLAVLGLITAGIWVHGHTVADDAAAAGAALASVPGADVEQARQAAERVASAGGLLSVSVDVRSEPGYVQVTVTGIAPQPFPGLSTVIESVRQPVERLP
jgi:hypothetical protein